MYRKHRRHPSVISIWSAPNYHDTRTNKAAVLKCDGEAVTVRQFDWRLHPFRLPNFMDAFSWSIPFICEKGEPTRPPHAIMFVVD